MTPDSATGVATPSRHPFWEIQALGLGLVVYGLLVLYGLVVFFPKATPTRELVASLKAIADDRLKAAAPLDTALVAAQRARDSAAIRHWAALAEGADRTASLARGVADSVERTSLDPSLQPSTLRILGFDVSKDFPIDWRFLILAMIAGAMGAFLHVAQSFATYVGNRSFSESWTWWYLLRPFMGAALAVVVYVVFRSALVPSSATVSNAYGIVALASLSGMFSKQAIDKLNEIFTVAFRSAPGQGDSDRTDKPTDLGSVPTISSIQPAEPVAQNGSLTFSVHGLGFSSNSVVFVDEVAATTTATDKTRLDATFLTKDLLGVGPFKLTVRTPPKPGAPTTDRGTVAGPMLLAVKN